MPNKYTEDSISVLSDLDHIRLRPGMYIGETDDPRHLLVEILDNALDESQSGTATEVIVEVDTTINEYSVYDNGRGIPIGLKKTTDGLELYVTEVISRYAKSGGKFDNSNYKIRSGLNGVGLSVVTAMSDYTYIKSHRDSKICITNYRTKEFDKSRKVIDELNVNTELYKGNKGDHYSVIKFIPTESRFKSSIIPIDFIVEKCKIANTEYNVKLLVDGESVDVSSSYSQLAQIPVDFEVFLDNTIKVKSSTGEMLVLWYSYANDTKYGLRTLCNLINTVDGGTHYRVVTNAIERCWEPFLKEAEEVELKLSDCRIGLYGVASVFISDPSFSSQTKEKLTVPASNFDELVENFSKEFTKWLKSNETVRKNLIKRFEMYRLSQNKLSNQKDIMKLIKINDSNDTSKVRRKSVVKKLIECTKPDRDGTELYLVEGDSAGGTASRSRNRVTQAVLPLRGKIKNVTYMSIKDALQSQEIQDIVNAIGAGIGESADPSKSRYERVIINADADPDGKHITALIMSAMINLLAPLVRAGMIYYVEPPLYGYTHKGKRHYCDLLSEIPNEIVSSGNFTRFKGLGEMDDIEYKESCITEGQRKLYKITYPDDIDHFNSIVGTSSGRSELLSELGLFMNLVNAKGDVVKDLLDS
jgi:DNA gyrase/topoisomerase IV subunit B